VTNRRLAVVWVVVVGTLGALLLVAGHTSSGLDDPDPAHQRPGFLDASGGRSAAPSVTPVVPSTGRRAVVFFVRQQYAAELCRALAADTSLRERADLAVASSGPVAPCAGVTMVTDAGGQLAAGYGMRQPVDRGPPVGYAVVDRLGRIRYRTLDPEVVAGLREVETMVRAVP
jgi:hypothetical protein